MILFTFLLFDICISTNQKTQPQIYLDELEKINELEKKLNQTLDLLFDYIKKKEQSINNSTSREFENQIEELIKRTEQIANKSKTISNYTRVLLSIVNVHYMDVEQPANAQYNYTGYFVPGDYPEIHYKPAITYNSSLRGVIFQHLTNYPCEANHFTFTFYDGPNLISKSEILLGKNLSNVYNFDNISNFDLLVVEVISKIGDSYMTCIPEFVLFAKDEEN